MNNRWALPLIVIAQFTCTSLWFAGNAILPDIQADWGLPAGAVGHITASVQLGFIGGTLVFALLTISDRFSPTRVFFVSAVIGALLNSAVILVSDFYSLLSLRALTGFFLAGIYPVGMKIASDYHEKGLGKALGYLVGALVLGTAFPHLLKVVTHALNWKVVLLITSGAALTGGILMLWFVPDGPFRKRSSSIQLSKFLDVFKNKEFRSAAFGYFGHMWELYTFWAFVPVMLSLFIKTNLDINQSLLAFIIIGVGGLSCVAGGYLAVHSGSAKIAFRALLISGVCCLLSPAVFQLAPPLVIPFLIIWGASVVADSPQFSALVARFAPKDSVGTALTIVNCIGFSITIISIQFVNLLIQVVPENYVFLLLSPGPVLGLFAMRPVLRAAH